MVASGPLVERDEELVTLDSMLDAAVAGRGRLAVVEGPAGIGKTCLLEVVQLNATGRGMHVFRARGSDLEAEFAFGVVRQLFERPLARAGPERDSLLGGVAGHTAPIFAAHDDADLDTIASPAALSHGLYWLVANLAERTPLLVAVDDAQWADIASLRFLDYLCARLYQLPVAVALAVKPLASAGGMELVNRILADPLAAVLRPRPLSASATSALVRSLLSADADDRFCRACYAASGGNPLLLHELIEALRQDRVVGGRVEASGVARLVPEAVARHVLVRLSRLPASASALARAAAVLGDGAELRHAATLAGLDRSDAAAAFDALVDVDILAAGRQLEFVHPLLREVLYTELAPGERARWHARAARLLCDARADPERIASQLLACEPAGIAWAVDMLREAARRALTRGAAPSAVSYLTRALAEPPADADRADVLTELGLAEARESMPSAADHLTQAMQLTADPVRRALITPELAVALEYGGRPRDAVTVLESQIEALGDHCSELRLSLEAQAVVAANTYLDARRALLPRVAHARAEVGTLDAPDAASLQVAIGYELALRGGTAEQAAAHVERGLAEAHDFTDMWSAVVSVIATEALSLCGRWSRAESVINTLIAAGRDRGATLAVSSALTSRAGVFARSGRLVEAEADALLALELAEQEPADFLRPLKLARLTDALIARGEIAAVATILTPTELARHEADRTHFQLALRDSHARLLIARGNHVQALEELRIIEHGHKEWDIRNPGWTRWRPTAALIHHQLELPRRAEQLANDELHAARAFGAPHAIGIALRTTGVLAAAGGIDQLHESADILEHTEARLEHAHTLVELGSALRRAGHRADARQPLHTGLELADQCGARPLAKRARDELLSTGARPRRPAILGPDSLTPSERRIAVMAADGLSNREIAQTLYVSLKTVEMHLGHTYRKLGIGSREELGRALPASDR